MNEERIKAKNIRTLVVIITIISIFILIINFIPNFVVNAGLKTNFTGDLYPDYLAYVNKSNPDKNYAEYWEVSFGNFCETFIHFNLESLPKKTEELYFSLGYFDTHYYCEQSVDDVEINIILIESNWNASEITWNNKPQHEEIIDTVNASEIRQGLVIERYNFTRAVNLTEIFRNNQYNDISLCINITENNENLNCSILLLQANLLWNYEKIILSYTTIISTIIIFSMLIGTIHFLRKDIYYCKKCGTKRSLIEKVCSSCRTSFNEDIFLKGSNYQLVLIVLWIFTFFEVAFIVIMLLVSSWIYFVLPLIIALILIPWFIFCYAQIRKKIKLYKQLKFYRE